MYRGADDLFVNARLVARGYAYVETVPPNVAHAEQFRRLARAARERELGLWSVCPNDGSGPISDSDRCLPDYRGACVPPPPPDLDCDDIGRPVRVVGEDPHSLDADGDGRACASSRASADGNGRAREAGAEEVHEPWEEVGADRRQDDAGVRCVGVHDELGVVAGHLPTCGHEEGVVDQVVVAADGEQRRRHPAEVGIQR